MAGTGFLSESVPLWHRFTSKEGLQKCHMFCPGSSGHTWSLSKTGRKPCAVIIFSGGLGLLVVQGLSSLLPLSLLLSALLAGIISCANTVFLYRSARWDSLPVTAVRQLDYICCTFPSQTET